jgi:hypothetical protein
MGGLARSNAAASLDTERALSPSRPTAPYRDIAAQASRQPLQPRSRSTRLDDADQGATRERIAEHLSLESAQVLLAARSTSTDVRVALPGQVRIAPFGWLRDRQQRGPTFVGRRSSRAVGPKPPLSRGRPIRRLRSDPLSRSPRRQGSTRLGARPGYARPAGRTTLWAPGRASLTEQGSGAARPVRAQRPLTRAKRAHRRRSRVSSA